MGTQKQERTVYVNSTLAERRAARLAAEDQATAPEPETSVEPESKAIQKAANKAIQTTDTTTK